MFRSKQCAFLGYSAPHKGVKCLDISTGRVYISRDVVFDETLFPFEKLHPNAGALLRQEILLLPPSLSGLDHEGDNSSSDLFVTNHHTMAKSTAAGTIIPGENRVQNAEIGGHFMCPL